MYCKPIMTFVCKPIIMFIMLVLELNSTYDIVIARITETVTAISVILGCIYLIMKIAKNDTKE